MFHFALGVVKVVNNTDIGCHNLTEVIMAVIPVVFIYACMTRT